MNNPQDRQRKVLGKGLSALLPAKTPAMAWETQEKQPSTGAVVHQIALTHIDPNPLQPRTVFDPTKLEELAESIRAHGLIQPLIVRRKQDRYELVAGERRLRAAKLAGLTAVSAIIQDYADVRILEIALVENIQREDLNPIETAQALDRLAREMNLSHDDIGRRTGKDRTTVTNLLRLLRLPAEIQLLVAEHRLSMGHARAILGLADPNRQVELAERAAAQGYSVRQTERLVQDATRIRQPANEKTDEREDPNTIAATRDLESALGTRVKIVEKTPNRGSIQIEYFSEDERDRIYDMLLACGPKSNGAGGRS